MIAAFAYSFWDISFDSITSFLIKSGIIVIVTTYLVNRWTRKDLNKFKEKAAKKQREFERETTEKQNEFKKELDKVRRDWAKDINRLKAHLDNSKLVFKFRFEHLYTTYVQISRQIHNCRDIANKLMMNEFSPYNTWIVNNREYTPIQLLEHFKKEVGELELYIASNVPFIQTEVANLSNKLLILMTFIVDPNSLDPTCRDMFDIQLKWHENKTKEQYTEISKQLNSRFFDLYQLMRKEIENKSILEDKDKLQEKPSELTEATD